MDPVVVLAAPCCLVAAHRAAPAFTFQVELALLSARAAQTHLPIPSRPTTVRRGGLSSLPAPLPFTFITGVGAGVPDSWSELSSGGGRGYWSRGGEQLWTKRGAVCARWDSGLQRAQLMEGGRVGLLLFVFKPTSLEWSPRSGAGQRTHRQDKTLHAASHNILVSLYIGTLHCFVGPTTLVPVYFCCSTSPLVAVSFEDGGSFLW